MYRGRLAQVHKNGLLTSDYTYDNNGNRLTHNGTEATYNSQDQILTYDSKSFTWDQNGFLKTMSEGGQITTYNYDIQHNLRSVELPNGEQVEYIIDARNRRIGKKVNGIQTEGFLYKDQLNPYAWMDGSGNEKAIFIYGEMTHVPSYMIKSGIKYKYVTDHLGSVRALVNTSTGTLAQSITYDEFGNQLSNTNPDFQPFGYVGGITDYDTDLIRFGARDYDPSIGRWTSKEPLGFGGALNWYCYVSNNPILYIDPYGTDEMILIDNTTLRYESDDGSVVEMEVTTGVPGVSDPTIENQGPIPPGEYILFPDEITPTNFAREYIDPRDWGDYRAPLHPLEGTDTYGRSNFFIHGGEEPGSAGCVDVGDSDQYLFSLLLENNEPIKLTVCSTNSINEKRSSKCGN
jgi:RHS repeat-associated protein